MRLANLGGRAVLVLDDDHGVDVEGASAGRFGPDPQSLFEDWTAFKTFAAGLHDAGDALRAETVPLDGARLGPPVPCPAQVFGIGLNYRAHAAESGAEVPSIPATFTKFPTCLAGPHDDVVLPSGAVDWEVELVVVIGTRAHRSSRATAWDHVAGLMVGQDLSEREVQFAAGAQFSLGKSYPGFAPTGPWLVSTDEVAEPDALALGCAIDGETVQSGRTSDMVFDVAGLIVELSAVVPLLPGDLIFTGTPDGVGFTRHPPRFLAPGQVLESWIDGIGRLRNTMT